MQNEGQFSTDCLPALLQQIASGDQSAFEQVYNAYYTRLYRFALAMVRTKEPAEEIVEDVFIKIWQQKENAPSIQNLKVYLYTATKNTALNYLARTAKESVTEPFDNVHISLDSTSISPEQVMITTQLLKKIQDAVDALPPRCKMIFKLVREDGLRYKEIAEILNISVNTIDAQMAIAIKRISAAVETEFGFPLKKGLQVKK